MSTSILKSQTYNNIGKTIVKILVRGGKVVNLDYLIKLELYECFGDILSEDYENNFNVEEFLKNLVELNKQSFLYTYEMRYPAAQVQIKVDEGEEVSAIQLMKYLECWIYNSGDSKSLRENKIYQSVGRFIGKLAGVIVRNTSEWETATWG